LPLRLPPRLCRRIFSRRPYLCDELPGQCQQPRHSGRFCRWYRPQPCSRACDTCAGRPRARGLGRLRRRRAEVARPRQARLAGFVRPASSLRGLACPWSRASVRKYARGRTSKQARLQKTRYLRFRNPALAAPAAWDVTRFVRRIDAAAEWRRVTRDRWGRATDLVSRSVITVESNSATSASWASAPYTSLLLMCLVFTRHPSSTFHTKRQRYSDSSRQPIGVMLNVV